MSYVLIGYLVDVPKLKAIVGAKDSSAVETVIENSPEDFDADDDAFEDEEDDELTLAAALRQLLLGEEMDHEDAHQYGYALKAVCDCYGESLPCQMWNGVRWSAVKECGLVDLLQKTGPPIELPPNDDAPSIGQVRRGDVEQYLQAARKRLDESQDSEVQDLLDEYIGWLETAQSKSLDLVFFYH